MFLKNIARNDQGIKLTKNSQISQQKVVNFCKFLCIFCELIRKYWTLGGKSQSPEIAHREVLICEHDSGFKNEALGGRERKISCASQHTNLALFNTKKKEFKIISNRIFPGPSNPKTGNGFN